MIPFGIFQNGGVKRRFSEDEVYQMRSCYVPIKRVKVLPSIEEEYEGPSSMKVEPPTSSDESDVGTSDTSYSVDFGRASPLMKRPQSSPKVVRAPTPNLMRTCRRNYQQCPDHTHWCS